MDSKRCIGMDLDLYRAARDGNAEFIKELNDGDATNILKTLTPLENTALHVSAIYGQEGFARELLRKRPSLLHQRNKEGNAALHFAARGRHVGLIKLLTEEYSKLHDTDDVEAQLPIESQGDLDDKAPQLSIKEEAPQPPQLPIKPCFWTRRNGDDNTAMHEALRNRQTEIASRLLELEPTIGLYVNKADESPLYLAAQRGLLQVVKKIVNGKPSSFSQEGPAGLTPLHAAVIGKRSDIVKLLLEKVPNIITKVEHHGKTALHFAVELNYIEIIKLLLKEDRMLGYVVDDDGLSPLLIAAKKGHSHAVDTILNYCPDSVELFDPSGKNALHLAVNHNSYFDATVTKLWRRPEVHVLINGRDNEGNTPLHLASKRTRLPVVFLLSTVPGVDFMAINKDGFTAQHIKSSTVIFMRQAIIREYLKLRTSLLGGISSPKPSSKSVPGHEREELMAIAQNLSVVATLLAAVTFAAAFTMPGGYESEHPDQGKPLLLEKPGFYDKINFSGFIVCDITAAFSSTATTILLVRGMLGDGEKFDDEHLFKLIRRSWYLLMFAFCATVFAFIFTIHAILPFTIWRVAGVGTLLLLTFIFIYFL